MLRNGIAGAVRLRLQTNDLPEVKEGRKQVIAPAMIHHAAAIARQARYGDVPEPMDWPKQLPGDLNLVENTLPMGYAPPCSQCTSASTRGRLKRMLTVPSISPLSVKSISTGLSIPPPQWICEHRFHRSRHEKMYEPSRRLLVMLPAFVAEFVSVITVRPIDAVHPDPGKATMNAGGVPCCNRTCLMMNLAADRQRRPRRYPVRLPDAGWRGDVKGTHRATPRPSETSSCPRNTVHESNPAVIAIADQRAERIAVGQAACSSSSLVMLTPALLHTYKTALNHQNKPSLDASPDGGPAASSTVESIGHTNQIRRLENRRPAAEARPLDSVARFFPRCHREFVLARCRPCHMSYFGSESIPS